MHFVGMAGLPRRYYTNTAFPYFYDLADINVLITVFALIVGLAQLVFYSTSLQYVLRKKLNKIHGNLIH